MIVAYVLQGPTLRPFAAIFFCISAGVGKLNLSHVKYFLLRHNVSGTLQWFWNITHQYARYRAKLRRKECHVHRNPRPLARHQPRSCSSTDTAKHVSARPTGLAERQAVT